MLRDLLHQLLAELRLHSKLLAPPARLPNKELTLVVGANYGTQQLHTFGRHYNMIYSPTSLAVSLNIPGVGIAIPVNLNAAWNVLNLPDGTEIYSTAAGANALLYRATDDSQGGVY